jgi:hypothetical protein
MSILTVISKRRKILNDFKRSPGKQLISASSEHDR